MNADATAAAERLRRWYAAETPEERAAIYSAAADSPIGIHKQFRADEAECAEAYLATVPADGDEPTTERYTNELADYRTMEQNWHEREKVYKERIADLECQNADLKCGLEHSAKEHQKLNEAVLARLSEVQRENAKLREALKPFADIWHGNQDGTTRIPWDSIKQAADALGVTGEKGG